MLLVTRLVLGSLRTVGLLSQHSLHMLTTSSVMFVVAFEGSCSPKALRHSPYAEASALFQEAIEQILPSLSMSRVQFQLLVSCGVPSLT